MSLLDRYLPAPALRQVDRIAVAAGPERAWALARHVDMFRLGFVRRLFSLRALPARLFGRGEAAPGAFGIDAIPRAGNGFILLDETPGREVVIGAAGKVWKPDIEFATVTPEGYAAFEDPGFVKVAWCLRVDPRAEGGSWMSVDVRVRATDAASWKRFTRYWRVIGPFSHAIREALLNLFVRELGTVADDEDRALPGDDILDAPRFDKTHAVTIEAPPARVWPWLVQIGARRAGWYSWDFLDNGGTPSADRIIPELQKLAVGDIIPATPASPDGFAVLRLEPERTLILGDPALLPGGHRTGGPARRVTWAFVLEPIGDDATRLVVRVRAEYDTVKMAVVAPLLGAAHEIMERRQLRNLRRRAELTPS